MIEMTYSGFALACVTAFLAGICFGFVIAMHLAGYICDKISGEAEEDAAS